MSFFQKLKKNIVVEKPEEESKKEKKTLSTANKKIFQKGTKEAREKWFESEGKLAIDLYKVGSSLVIQSTIAGVKPEDLEITIQGGIVNIKGVRIKQNEEPDKFYFSQECYWGPFSKQIVLPEEVDPTRIEASLKEGILTIRIPRIEKEKKRKVKIEAMN